MRSWVWKGKGKHGDIEESQTKNCFGWFPSLSVSLILFFWLCAFYFIFWYIKKCKASVIDIQFKKKTKKRAHVNKTVVECLVQIHTLRRKSFLNLDTTKSNYFLILTCLLLDYISMLWNIIAPCQLGSAAWFWHWWNNNTNISISKLGFVLIN